MRRWTMQVAVMALMLAPAARADDAKTKPMAKTDKMAEQGKAIFLTPDTLKWGPAPPDVPKGAQLAVLSGDPMKPGFFTIRLKAPDGYKIPPHWHTRDEHLTVVSGNLLMYMGDKMEGEPHSLKPNDFHFLPGKMHHAAQAKGETVVQISGPGPFDIHYINPADNPNPKSAKR